MKGLDESIQIIFILDLHSFFLINPFTTCLSASFLEMIECLGSFSCRELLFLHLYAFNNSSFAHVTDGILND